MGTDPALADLAFHRCGEVFWSKTAVRDWFVSYGFSSDEVYGLSKEAVQARKRVRDVDASRRQ